MDRAISAVFGHDARLKRFGVTMNPAGNGPDAGDESYYKFYSLQRASEGARVDLCENVFCFDWDRSPKEVLETQSFLSLLRTTGRLWKSWLRGRKIVGRPVELGTRSASLPLCTSPAAALPGVFGIGLGSTVQTELALATHEPVDLDTAGRWFTVSADRRLYREVSAADIALGRWSPPGVIQLDGSRVVPLGPGACQVDVGYGDLTTKLRISVS